jgi:CheY-like chemotaxis protein
MKRVLIVEDEFIIALLVERQLRKLGHEVCGKATSGLQAIETLKITPCDFILMDIKINGSLDGIETMKEIRRFSNIPVVYVTGNSDPRTRDRASGTNPSGYLIKPIEFVELDNLIRSATKN